MSTTGLRKLKAILENKEKALHNTFNYLFGNDLPLPNLVHGSDDSGRQSVKLDGYTTETDLPFLQSTFIEMRLVLTLLCVLIRLQTTLDNPGYERKFHAAAILRDLVNGFLENCETPNGSSGFKGVLWGGQILGLRNGRLQHLVRSRVSACRGWHEFREWWVSVVTGALELPSVVMQNPVTSF